MKDDKIIVSSNYLITLYESVMRISELYPELINTNRYIEKYHDKEYLKNLDALDDSDRNSIIQLIAIIRKTVMLVQIQLVTLSDKLNFKVTEQMRRSHDIIASDYLINEDDLKKYVMEANKILCTTVMEDMLNNANNILNNINKG